MEQGQCQFGNACPCAHGVFELWLHPSKYKTELCTRQREPGKVTPLRLSPAKMEVAQREKEYQSLWDVYHWDKAVFVGDSIALLQGV